MLLLTSPPIHRNRRGWLQSYSVASDSSDFLILSTGARNSGVLASVGSRPRHIKCYGARILVQEDTIPSSTRPRYPGGFAKFVESQRSGPQTSDLSIMSPHAYAWPGSLHRKHISMSQVLGSHYADKTSTDIVFLFRNHRDLAVHLRLTWLYTAHVCHSRYRDSFSGLTSLAVMSASLRINHWTVRRYPHLE